MSLTFYLNSDNILTVVAQNYASGEYMDGAEVMVTLLDEAGVEVLGQEWPTTALHVSGMPGVYRAVLSKNLEMTRAAKYRATTVIDGGAGLGATLICEVVAATYGCPPAGPCLA